MNLPSSHPSLRHPRLFYELLFEALSVVIAMNYPCSSCLAWSSSFSLEELFGSSVVSNNFSTNKKKETARMQRTTSTDWMEQGWSNLLVIVICIFLFKYCLQESLRNWFLFIKFCFISRHKLRLSVKNKFKYCHFKFFVLAILNINNRYHDQKCQFNYGLNQKQTMTKWINHFQIMTNG